MDHFCGYLQDHDRYKRCFLEVITGYVWESMVPVIRCEHSHVYTNHDFSAWRLISMSTYGRPPLTRSCEEKVHFAQKRCTWCAEKAHFAQKGTYFFAQKRYSYLLHRKATPTAQKRHRNTRFYNIFHNIATFTTFFCNIFLQHCTIFAQHYNIFASFSKHSQHFS